MKHLLVALACALCVIACSRAEKAAPVVVASGTTQEQHREIEEQAARASGASGDLEDAFESYGAGDYPTALFRFQALAAKGDSAAAYYVGVLHSNGEGVKRDLAESAKWYRQAADLGNPDGMYALARLHVIGTGVPLDLQKAVDLFQRAADTYPAGEKREEALSQRAALLKVMEETGKTGAGTAAAAATGSAEPKQP